MGGEADHSGRLVNETTRPDQRNERDSPTTMSATVPATPASNGPAEQRGGSDFSRRDLLKRAGMLGAAAAVQVGGLAPAGAAEPARKATQARAAMPVRESLETLTAAESDTLEAIVARLIPTDENGPGVAEARAAHYIDRALTGPLAPSRAAYSAGLAAVDAYARASKGAPFAKLSAKDQDTILSDMEKNTATGFTPNSAAFFNLLRTHTIEGTFCDPYYGGNANFIGWDLIGYPGVRLAVGPDQQRMGAKQKPTHWSAYDYDMFLKVANRGGMSHGR
jgi:gluconate 2-dehydrogenase gamma chain